MNIKNFPKTLLILAFSLVFKNITIAQCGARIPLGSAFNMITKVKNSTNSVAVDKDLNTAIFIHRHNSNVFGGNSGNLRYDISTNGGSSWTTNLGVLNPISTSAARYPQVTIYNPLGNTNPSNAYLGYLAATTNNNLWNGAVAGVRQLNGGGNTETYNQASPPSYLVNCSLVKGAPGVFWAVDFTSNGTNYTGGISIYKGQWNGSNNINWSTNTVLYPSFDLTYNNIPHLEETNIAFDPTGTTGWLCIMGHLNYGPFNYGYYPIFYKTTNAGQTWTGPTLVNPSQFSCITSNMVAGMVPASYYMADLTVDMNGNPHLLTTVGNGDNDYGIDENLWHHMFDITQVNGVWTAHDIANVKGAPVLYYGSITSTVTQAYSPQVSRSADGAKIFFSWCDNSSYSLGAPNTSPNLFARAFDVQQNMWTQVKDFSSCNAATNGKIFWPHLSAEVLEPTTNVYKLAPVYGEMVVNADPDQTANFYFLDNCTFNSTDFNINLGSLSVNIQPTSPLLCLGSTINLQISGSFSQISWSNGGTSMVNPVNSAGQYVVTVKSGCLVASDTVVVKTLTLDVANSNLVVCNGSAVTLTVAGNAYSYTWSPGMATGTSITVSPNVSTTYVVTASGDQNCTSSRSINVLVDACTSIEELDESEQVKVFPNPGNGKLYIEGNLKGASYKIYDQLGALAGSGDFDGGQQVIDIIHLSNGVYYLEIRNHQAQKRMKVIKTN